jgi:hypothetical protein
VQSLEIKGAGASGSSDSSARYPIEAETIEHRRKQELVLDRWGLHFENQGSVTARHGRDQRGDYRTLISHTYHAPAHQPFITPTLAYEHFGRRPELRMHGVISVRSPPSHTVAAPAVERAVVRVKLMEHRTLEDRQDWSTKIRS